MSKRVDTQVYFIEAENGLIKIGVSVNPAKRARDILSISPIKVRLIIAYPGDGRDERAAHQRYRQSRAWNEWFHCTDELAIFVERERGLGVKHILDWPEISFLAAFEERRARSKALKSEAMKRTWKHPKRRAEWLEAMARGRARVRAAKTALCEAAQ